MTVFDTKNYTADLCVIGGGLAGCTAALSAARKGVKVVLVQDRPVLGGNSSSEIRMWVRGAKGYCNKETGLLAEFEEENIYRNPTLSWSLWDSVLFGKIKENKNITLLLNTSCLDAECKDGRILSITAWQLTTYTYCKVSAKYFADCSGDSVLAYLTGAKHSVGREAKSDFGEKIAPETADRKTMGMSILLQARETDHKVDFIPPKWANVYKSDEDFSPFWKNIKHSTFRDHTVGTSGCNLWWIELGGDDEPILCTENVKDELLKAAFGIWDHIKNRGSHGCENWELEWVGFLPGKRESTRYTGDYILTQNDIETDKKFDDCIAYGGWPLDDHNPLGLKAVGECDVPSKMYPAPSPYQIPYRCIYSVNIENLFFAGRNISVTHAALSSTRVMGTCSLLGQALGNAVKICAQNGIMPRDIIHGRIKELQKEIMDDGIMLPGLQREISDLTKSAYVNLPDAEKNILFDGTERPRTAADRHCIVLNKGDKLSFCFDKPKTVGTLRIQFDPDFSRMSVSPNVKMRVFAQKLNTGLDFEPVKVADTIVKSFDVYVDGKLVFLQRNNYNSLVKIPLETKAVNIEIRFYDTWGCKDIIIYGCDFL